MIVAPAAALKKHPPTNSKTRHFKPKPMPRTCKVDARPFGGKPKLPPTAPG